MEDSDAMEVIEYWREEYLAGDDIGDYEEDEYYDREDDYSEKFDNEDYYEDEEEYY